jgi:Ca2+-binding EF-hand superfamily protein
MSLSIGGNFNAGNVHQQRFDPQKAFNKIDSDGNGSLNVEEFGKVGEKLSKMSGKELNADEIFSKLDSNQDGSLSMDEMGTLRDQIKSAVKGKFSQAMFNSKGDLQSQLSGLQNEGYKNLLDILNNQDDSRDETFSLFDVKV